MGAEEWHALSERSINQLLAMAMSACVSSSTWLNTPNDFSKDFAFSLSLFRVDRKEKLLALSVSPRFEPGREGGPTASRTQESEKVHIQRPSADFLSGQLSAFHRLCSSFPAYKKLAGKHAFFLRRSYVRDSVPFSRGKLSPTYFHVLLSLVYDFYTQIACVQMQDPVDVSVLLLH